ncbi:HNH endonuclease [Saccharothrix carnea]|uniref:HNH endonuclease n=1 Tax=Saccharothrix carnea TaxID=1280637 RepID=UPI0011B21C3A|nr:HNH endonuclease [Saccharothrix carnea]
MAMVERLAPAGTSERPVRHQGILLLWAIGRAARGLPRLVRWTDAREELRPLLTALGREGSRPTPQYPFVALAETQWWEIPEVLEKPPRAHGSAPLKWLTKHNPLAGLPAEVYDLLATDVDARDAVVRALLHRFFRDSPTAEALRLTGLVGPLDGQASRSDPPLGLPKAVDLLRDLIGIELRTASGKPNTILRVRGDDVVVKTERSPEGQPVPVSAVQQGLDLLAARGSVRVVPDELGHRSSFVGAVLVVLPGARFTGKPAVVVLDELSVDDIAGDHHNGRVDSIAQVKVRLEQGRLRSLLAGGRTSAQCALCGDLFPLDFLIAAHIKKRASCTDDERRDLANVAMLACTFGCDALYESGWITVDDNGLVRTRPPDGVPQGNMRDRLNHLRGRSCTAYRPSSAPYFEWHRTTIFAT